LTDKTDGADVFKTLFIIIIEITPPNLPQEGGDATRKAY